VKHRPVGSMMVPLKHLSGNMVSPDSKRQCSSAAASRKRKHSGRSRDADAASDKCLGCLTEEGQYEQLHMLLGRLSPGPRRVVLHSCLSEQQRQKLEAWMLQRKHSVCSNAPSMPSEKRKRGAIAAGVCATKKGVVRVTQRSKVLGRVLQWHFAVACAADLHIVARNRPSQSEALADHQTLLAAKRAIVALTARGVVFETAVRRTLGNISWKGCPRHPRAGGMSDDRENLYLRFTVGVCALPGQWPTMVRSPGFHNLEEALAARARMHSAAGMLLTGGAWTLSYRDCAAALVRLRKEFLHLREEAGLWTDGGESTRQSLANAKSRFDIVEERVHRQRDCRTLKELKKLLGPSALQRLDAILEQQANIKMSEELKAARSEAKPCI